MRIEKNIAYPFSFWVSIGVFLGNLFSWTFDVLFYWSLIMTIIFAGASYTWYKKTNQTLTDWFISSIFSIPVGIFFMYMFIRNG